MKSKYLLAYERLCPTDKLTEDDPRKADIIAEMKAVAKAKTNREAADIIRWWGWDNDQQLTSFVYRARKLIGDRE
jgi:hypothetical protein